MTVTAIGAYTKAMAREHDIDISPGAPVTTDWSSLPAGGRQALLDQKIAGITRQQWQHFLDVYQPVEMDLLKKAMQTDFTQEGNAAGQDARAGVQAGRGMLARSLSRMGTGMTPEQAAAVRRRSKLAESKGVAQAENTTRRTLSDSRTNLLAGMVGLGRQAATGAMSGFQSAADNAASTGMMLEQGKAAADNTNMAAAASLASLLIMFA